MTQRGETMSGMQPAPLKVSRIFHAPRKRVFDAWSSADHVKRWFCPNACTIPDANVDMREGGVFELRMLGPDRIDHRIRGIFLEVLRHDRLVIDMRVLDGDGCAMFRAFTEVDFADALGGTRMDVVQTYTFENPAAAERSVAGAQQGWKETLDRLDKEVSGKMDAANAGRSAVHATFSLERSYDAPAERVFRAFSDKAAKSMWFAGDEGRCKILERELDFRPGGRERLKGQWEGGMISTFDAIYHDIVANERIVYTYEMHLDERKISVSLATIEITAQGPHGTKLRVTEQGCFLDGYDDAGSRENGTGFLLDRLGASLAR